MLFKCTGEYSLGSDGSSPNASNANTPDSGELLDDHVGDTGKTSPMSMSHSNVEKSSNIASEPMSLPVNSASNISSSPSNHYPVPNFSSNQNQSSNLVSSGGSVNSGSVSVGFGGSNNVNSHGPSSMNRDNSSTSQNNNPDSFSTSPVSLPAWGTEKRSVKELAASLARQQNQQDEIPKKKADSLPRNVTTGTTIEHQQGLHEAIY